MLSGTRPQEQPRPEFQKLWHGVFSRFLDSREPANPVCLHTSCESSAASVLHNQSKVLYIHRNASIHMYRNLLSSIGTQNTVCTLRFYSNAIGFMNNWTLFLLNTVASWRGRQEWPLWGPWPGTSEVLDHREVPKVPELILSKLYCFHS